MEQGPSATEERSRAAWVPGAAAVVFADALGVENLGLAGELFDDVDVVDADAPPPGTSAAWVILVASLDGVARTARRLVATRPDGGALFIVVSSAVSPVGESHPADLGALRAVDITLTGRAPMVHCVWGEPSEGVDATSALWSLWQAEARFRDEEALEPMSRPDGVSKKSRKPQASRRSRRSRLRSRRVRFGLAATVGGILVIGLSLAVIFAEPRGIAAAAMGVGGAVLVFIGWLLRAVRADTKQMRRRLRNVERAVAQTRDSASLAAGRAERAVIALSISTLQTGELLSELRQGSGESAVVDAQETNAL
ncbi:MAG: hypothetical protein FWD59_07595 [Micrococcales bacterium]|nr:hypothetical protein [Micrococcales bacterium]